MATGYAVFGVVMLVAIGAIVMAYKLAQWVMARDTGTEGMQKISNAIKAGAEAFMRRMNSTIAMLSILIAALIFCGYYFLEKDTGKAVSMTVSFVVGALCSGFAGYFGMFTSIRSNIRTASAARRSLNEALQVALRGGAVSGLLVVALSLAGVGLMFVIFGGLKNEQMMRLVPLNIVGFGFGASFVALFAQLGGGIYTKAADVGADLVGKVEAGIPEDDPRNPAVIADLVGDNVGDCAGRGADLFESTAAENIGAMILGIALAAVFGIKGILFPLFAGSLGLIASIVGIYSVRIKAQEDPMQALNRGYYITTALAIVGFFLACALLLRTPGTNSFLWFFGCGLMGIIASFLFVWITQYYTETKYRPVRQIADACQTGPATTIISGLAVGMECTFFPVIVISAAILTSFWMGMRALAHFAQLPATDPQFIAAHSAGLYGTAVATIGMLSTAGYILAMDTFGPITDNAGGIVEMGMTHEESGEIRDRTDRLDAVGNTTKALTKGYAVGSAALAAFLLFSAYLDQVWHYVQIRGLKLPDGSAMTLDHVTSVNIGKPAVFVGGLIGAMLVFVFSSLAMKAVSKAAQTVIAEVRRQFQSDPGIMAGTSEPDYGRCVDIVTKGALKAMIPPGMLPVLFPLGVGLIVKYAYPAEPILGAEAVAALLMIGTVAGILMALFMNNGGGAWDNAKKYIEEGHYGGKGSFAHKAGVVGDTVGDPFKDTAGPSLHVLIKLLSTITLVMAPLFIR